VDVVQGSLDDLDRLRSAASDADAVIHLAFNHDFSRFEQNSAQDRRAIETLGDALKGSDKILLVTSGVALLAPGRVATEADVPTPNPSYPRRSEEAYRMLADRGVHAAAVRLAPSVHGVGEKHGFVPVLMDIAPKAGVSAYVRDGTVRWPAVHVEDAAGSSASRSKAERPSRRIMQWVRRASPFEMSPRQSVAGSGSRWSHARQNISTGWQALSQPTCQPPAIARAANLAGRRTAPVCSPTLPILNTREDDARG